MPLTIRIPAFNIDPKLATKFEARIGEDMRRTVAKEKRPAWNQKITTKRPVSLTPLDERIATILARAPLSMSQLAMRLRVPSTEVKKTLYTMLNGRSVVARVTRVFAGTDILWAVIPNEDKDDGA